MTIDDLHLLNDIDATIESKSYLHVSLAADGLAWKCSIEEREAREKHLTPNAIGEDERVAFKQILEGIREGWTCVAEHDGMIVGSAVALFDPEERLFHLVDIRVDFDQRRNGLATAMLYQLMAAARDQQARAVRAETPSNNLPYNNLLRRLNFELAGVDTKRHTNHDLVKEQATLIWYLALEE